MSAPARSMQAPVRRSEVPKRPRPKNQGQPARRTDASIGRRVGPRRRIGFALFASALVGMMVFGLVAMNALLAQSSFRIDDLSKRVDGLSREHLRLTREAATLSAPDRIASWAHRHGMRPPDEIHILHVPAVSRGAPVGGPDAPDRERLALKAVVEGQP
ncbi:MAG: hypothetical protein ACT4PO_02720 [Actinomycetota bacterium]